MNPVDLSYAAALIDGEGCIGAYNNRSKKDTRARNYQVVVRVCMKTHRAVSFMHSLFGGQFKVQKSKGPDKPGPYYYWVVTDRTAEECLKLILPYLKDKVEQAQVALQFCDLRRRQRASTKRNAPLPEAMLLERDSLILKLKALKREVEPLPEAEVA